MMLSWLAGAPLVLLAHRAEGSQLCAASAVCRSEGRGVEGLQLFILQAVGHAVVETS